MPSTELAHAESISAKRADIVGHAPDVAQARDALAAYASEQIATTVPDDVSYESFELGGVTGEVVCPPYDPETRILILVHGGAWTFGSAAESRELAGRLSRSTHARVYCPDHRLAPEHPFPAGFQDVATVYRALVDDGADPREVGMVGESTGANLVLAALLSLKDDGFVLPGAAVLMSPVSDLTDLPGDDSPEWASVAACREGYLAGASATDPLASPSLATLDGLPPVLVQVGTADPALEQTRRLIDHLVSAGVTVESNEWAGMVHRWQVFPHIYDAGRATNLAGDYLLKKIGPGSVPVVPGT